MYQPNIYNQKGVGQLEDITYTPSNSSNAKKHPVNHTPSRIILATILPVLPVLGLSCRNHTKVKEPTPIVAPRDYTIEDLVAALGARWYSLNNEQKDMFKNAWLTAEDDIKRFMVEAYSDPESMYNRLPKDEKERFDAFPVTESEKKRISEYRKAFPWINTEQPTLPDKLVIYNIIEAGRIANLSR